MMSEIRPADRLLAHNVVAEWLAWTDGLGSPRPRDVAVASLVGLITEALVMSREQAERRPFPADRIPMPQNADQAVGMWLIGENWVRSNAPERLKPELRDEPLP